MENQFLQRFYYLFLFLSLVGLVFYAGFLFGYREKVNGTPDAISAINPNGQSLNAISRIQQRVVEGSKDAQNIETFGQMFFLVNKQNRTEIVIDLKNVPLKVAKADGSRQIDIPTTLRVDIAKRVQDTDGQETYVYENLSTNPDVLATLTLTDPINGLRSGSFSGYIKEPVIDEAGSRTGVERIVLRSADPEIQNIFIDPNSDLPLKVRGNPQARIIGQPAPFFWIKL